MQEFVVPRSMPRIFAMLVLFRGKWLGWRGKHALGRGAAQF